MTDPSIGDGREASAHRRWDEELERRGVAAITAYLASGGVGTGQNAEVHLFVTGLENPQRQYVERWLGRKEAEADRLAEDRHRETLKVSRKSARWAFWAFIAGAVAVFVGLLSLLK